jgi:hypothetical protein
LHAKIKVVGRKFLILLRKKEREGDAREKEMLGNGVFLVDCRGTLIS